MMNIHPQNLLILSCAFSILNLSSNNEDATYAYKEKIIEERQTSMFKEKYAGWLKDCDVSISQKFWEEFEI